MNPAVLSKTLATQEKRLYLARHFEEDILGEPENRGMELEAWEKETILQRFLEQRTEEEIEFYRQFFSFTKEAFSNPRNRGQSIYVAHEIQANKYLQRCCEFSLRFQLSSLLATGKSYTPCQYSSTLGIQREYNHHNGLSPYPIGKIAANEKGRSREVRTFKPKGSFILR